jgi:hypothetical protein
MTGTPTQDARCPGCGETVHMSGWFPGSEMGKLPTTVADPWGKGGKSTVWHTGCYNKPRAALVEQADTSDLKSDAERRDGSSPSGGTTTDTQADLTERARAFFTFEYMSHTPIEQRIKDVAAALQSEREAAAADARRAAIEECAQIANRVRRRAAENAEHISGRMGLGIDQLRRLDASLAGQRHAAHEIEDKLRTLASPAPQEETRDE